MVIGIDASRANVEQKTGTEWYSWHLIRHLVPLLEQHTVRLYSREPLQAGLRNLGPHVTERVLSWRLGFLWSHLRLSWEMLWHPPDVLFITADTVPIIHPKNTVTTIHDIAFERFPELYNHATVRRKIGWLRMMVGWLARIVTLGQYGANELDYHRWSTRQALRASRTIIAVSEFTKQELVQVLHARPEKVMVTHQGVIQPDEVAQEIQAANPKLLEMNSISQPYFLYNGRIESKKNIIKLLEGFSAFRTAGGQAALVLIGPNGVGANKVDTWLTSHPEIATHVHRLPWQATPDVWQFMRAAAGYVFVSAYEGFGRPPLEAFSCGTVVIASHSSSLPEVLGQSAIYVDPDRPESIRQGFESVLRLSPAERLVRINVGQNQVKRFQWSTVADQTAKILFQA